MQKNILKMENLEEKDQKLIKLQLQAILLEILTKIQLDPLVNPMIKITNIVALLLLAVIAE